MLLILKRKLKNVQFEISGQSHIKMIRGEKNDTTVSLGRSWRKAAGNNVAFSCGAPPQYRASSETTVNTHSSLATNATSFHKDKNVATEKRLVKIK